VLVPNEFTPITLDFKVAEWLRVRRLRMHRFLLLRFYVVGVVAVIGLAVWGVSMSRTARRGSAALVDGGKFFDW
jgi:hypothetical protein